MKILITGVSKGLGRALADFYMETGHEVIGCGRDPEKILDLRFGCDEKHRFDIVDVALANKVDVWYETVSASHGPPDLIINNAALMNKPAPLWEVPTKEFHQLIEVNVSGVFNVIHAFVPEMIARGTGVIVNLSSGWGRSTSAEVAPYCASKYAIEGLTQAMAQELPDPMAAIPLSPGVIATEMLRTAWGESADSHQTPEDWVKVAGPFILQLGRKDNGQSLSVPAA
ncbi:SDR family oxidoreductase [Synoicihabitans lomoniglobus]|uniref:SDR family NAD(P)-dependent oxidoreductase n=1 Tax=Synoicihabitans lomoniglobus TaxID=2909285 RepID=A0AAF0CT61_9BACT|nr:SDR family oxidoreductase [Opitutaceae bacterium LMO-M01]WED67446.1 SDR family NAD(P)-dependent oxidoreductase [Opitutaceae bacterium LMO-M01]